MVISKKEFTKILDDGNIIEAFDGHDYFGNNFPFVYFKKCKTKNFILRYVSKIQIEEPFKLNFIGKFYCEPVSIECSNYTILSKTNTKKLDDINIAFM